MFFQILISILVSTISCINYNYTVKSWTDLFGCHDLVNFSYNSKLDMIFFNEQNPNLQSQLIGVKNQNQLVQIIFQNSNIYQEILIKEFESKITLVEPKWEFERVYIVTFNELKNQSKIYEIDLVYKTIVEIVIFSLTYDQKLILTSDPFHGTVTYIVDNYFNIVNTNYLNLSQKSTQTNFKYLGKNENFLSESAYCIKSKYGSFEFVLTSSVIDGYESVQTYYIKTKFKYFKCLINVNSRCTCAPIKNLEFKENFMKISNYYSTNKCSLANREDISIQIENKKSYFKKHDDEFKKCLRICSKPQWKKELLYYDENSTLSYKDECINKWSINSSFEQFGIALEKGQNDTLLDNVYRLRINYYQEILNQIISSCSKFELSFKYSVFYRKLENFEEINQAALNSYSSNSSQESTIEILIDKNSAYEFNVFIQSPFDYKSFNLGTYLISQNYDLKDPENFTVPLYQKVKIDQNPIIYADNWYEHISANVAIISVFSESLNTDSIVNYILTDNNTGNSTIRKVQIDANGIESKLSKRLSIFKIENLNEDTVYNLRVFSEPEPNEISSFSNLIKFKTLKRPYFKIDSILSDSVYIDVHLYCKLVIEESNLNFYYKKIENACHLFKVYVKQETGDIWEQRMSVLVPDKTVKELPDYGDNFFHVKIWVKNLSSLTNYSIKIDLETYFSNINTMRLSSDGHILSSNIVKFRTREPFKNTNFGYIALVIIFFLSMVITSFLIMTIYLRKTNRIFFLNLKRKEFLEHERDKFLNANMLYSFTIGKKEFQQEIEKLNKIDEKNLELLRSIGKGAFGQVYEGLLRINGQEIPVAIKKLKENVYSSEKLDLIREAVALSSFDHPNLLKLYGICSFKNELNQLEVKFVLTELMNNRDLLSYLKLCRKTGQCVEYKKAVKIFMDISNACVYLESKGFIHRDLAARNCLVHVETKTNNNDLIVKLGDFGMSKELCTFPVKDYYKQMNSNDKLLPIRWMSPESISDGVYSSKTDVWSFGVIVWEVMTLGFHPFNGMDNFQVMEYIKNGGTLHIPIKCPLEMRNLMMSCWNKLSEKRPSFEEIFNYLVLIYQDKLNLDKNNNVIPIFDETYFSEISNFKISPNGSLKKVSNSSEFNDEGFSDLFSETHESSFNKENKSLIN
ncbi:unnamed protein product [Brachionus calyciflorus]|uniref:Protein kinase domain-containing protein n=1 Tax=Brachionus calyciflorus TaxID=104777 RepID=A0A813UME4_9BILA|nr:unnamed protein product [Brachionus calyciflorus]